MTAGGAAPLHVVHRAWFGSVFAAYVLFALLIPPFQTNDEEMHWRRLWVLATGQLTCGDVPRSVDDLVGASNFWPVRNDAQKYSFALIDQELAVRGTSELVPARMAPCLYPPTSYLVPALLARAIADPTDAAEQGRLWLAYYAARAFNLLLCSVSVLLFLRRVPWLRNLTLVLYSLPMMIHQGIAINQDSTILCLGLAILYLWWRPAQPRGALLLLLAISILSLTKPVYLVLLLLYLYRLLQLKRAGASSAPVAALAAASLMPIAACLWWTRRVAPLMNASVIASWVDIPAQLQYIKSHPLVVPAVVWEQLTELFGRGKMHGGWTTVLGVLGCAQVELRDATYYTLLAAVPCALAADYLATPAPPARGAQLRRLWETTLVGEAAFFALIPAITVVLYVEFSYVGRSYALGMQGRYLHLPYFGMLACAVDFVRRRWPPPVLANVGLVPVALSCASALLCWFGIGGAVTVILERWYGL
jgi:uncharacterized membrane protein